MSGSEPDRVSLLLGTYLFEDLSPAEVEPLARSVRRSARLVSTGGVYVNFLGNEGETRVRATYGDAKFRRLAELKRRFDPGNLFRLNQNIPPAA